ncbi:hypothetical protein AMJ57_00380 [Parcubacteria bacterium SG8_24]|nr:MAG: hypothetical protein AMJ57_00380 [Parcubacteria bacterium SG8_24]
MFLRDSELRGLPVRTVGGTRLGKVAGVIIDVETQTVVQYAVRKTRGLPVLSPPRLLIRASQVVSLDDKEMVVEDNTVTVEEGVGIEVSERAAGTAPSGAVNAVRQAGRG